MSQWDDLLKYAKEMCDVGDSIKYVMCGDKGCENCKYRECPKDEGLCESCHSWDFKWKPKSSCDTCAFAGEGDDFYPCDECDNGSQFVDNGKSCDNCEHEFKDCDEEPCRHCFDENKWEPKKYDEHIEALEDQIENYEDTIVDLSREVHELENLCDSQSELIDTYEDLIDSQREYIKELEDRIDDYKDDEATLDQYRKALTNTNAITDAAVALLRAAGYEVTYAGK